MKSFHFPFGLEEEFFLSCAESGALATNAATSLVAKARAEMASSVTSEMLRSQVEIASPFRQRNGVNRCVVVRRQLRSCTLQLQAQRELL